MAGSSFQEVLRLVIEAGGQGDVDLLIKQLDALEKVSATGSKEALALSEKLKVLATTAAQIQNYTKLKGEIAETNMAISAESEKLVKLNADLAAAEKPTAALERAVAKSKAAVESLLTTQNKQSVELQKTAGALSKAGVDTTHLADAQGKLSGEIEATTKHLGNVGTESGKAAGGVNKLEAASISAAEQVKHLALRLAEIVIAAETARRALEIGGDFIKDGIADAAALEDAFAQVKAVTGATADEMERLKASVEVATQTTKFNSLEAAQGLLVLARASGNANDASRELVPTLNLAQAAGVQVADAATLIVQALAEFRLGADSAGHVADLLAQGAKSGGIGLQGLADALEKTAPLAAQLNITADQTVAILSALASEGVRGRLAAGGLRDAFEQLADPFSAFSTRLQEMGITTRDFNEVIAELAKRPAQAQQALEALSANARPAIELLVADGGAKIRQLQGDLENAGGAAAKAAKEMENSFSGASDALGKSYDELKETLFTPVLIPLRDAVGELSKELDAFAKSKDFDEIKNALKDTFEEGAKAIHDLIANANFHELALQIKSFVVEAKGDITTFRENLAGIITTVKVIYEALKVFADTFRSVIYVLSTAIAGLLEGVTKVLVQLEKARNFDPTGLAHKFGLVTSHVEELQNASEAFGAAAEANYNKAGEAIADTGKALDDLGDAALASADDSDTATTSTVAHGKALKETGEAGHEAAAGIDAAADAAEKLTPAQKRAAQSADEVTQALHRLGITAGENLQDNLTTNAESAAKAFDLVVQQYRAGKLAIEDVRRAFGKYAEDQRASVANSDAWKKHQVETQIVVKAALSGVTSEFDGLGDHGERAGRRIEKSVGDAAESVDRLGGAVKNADEATNAFAERDATLAKLFGAATIKADGLSFSLGTMSTAAAEAYEQTNKLAVGASNFADMIAWGNAVNRVTAQLLDQQNALKGVNAELDAQLAKFDPLADKVKALQAQYGFVDPAALRVVAQKQQQLEDQQKQAAEADRRGADEKQRAAAEAAKTQAETASRDAAAAPSGGARPQTNPNLSHAAPNASGGRDSTFTIKLDLPSSASQHKLTPDQLQDLIPQIIEQIKRELETTFR